MGFVGLAKFGEQPQWWPDTQKKRKPKARLPNLDAMLAEGKSRKHLEIFLKTRGVSILEVEDSINLLIKRYNKKYPWTKYKERKPQQGPPLGGSGPRTGDGMVHTSEDPYPDGYVKNSGESQLAALKQANQTGFDEVQPNTHACAHKCISRTLCETF